MKLKKIIVVLLFTLFIIPFHVSAKDGTGKFFVNIDVQFNGDIFVQELVSLNGDYNGRTRSIYFENAKVSDFKGDESSFEGSKIYNGSSLVDLKVYEVDNASSITFADIKNKKNQYREVTSANAGEYGVFTQTLLSDGIDLKIFNPSNRDKAFYIEYTIKDAVVVHNDVAELAWNILGAEYEENIDDFLVKVNLPTEDEDLRVWLHGPLNGSIKREANKTAVIKYGFLGAFNPVSVRMMFDKKIVPLATKLSNTNGKEKILAVEKKAADKANQDRLVNNIIYYGINGVIIVWFVAAFISVFFVMKKRKDDMKRVPFDHDYFRDFPGEYGPEVLQYLLNKNINEEAFSASILNIIYKKGLNIKSFDQKDDIILELGKPKEPLTEEEQIIVTLLIDTVGDKKEVSLNALKKYGKTVTNAKRMVSQYEKWKKKVISISKAENFYDKAPKIVSISAVICALGFVISMLGIVLGVDSFLLYIAIFVSIILLLVVVCIPFKTDKGNLQYKQWMAFKKFLMDFGNMDEKQLPEIAIWQKYLVYATILGCAKEVEKQMRVRMDSMNLSEADYYAYGFYYNPMGGFIHSSITSSISSGVHQAVASSRSSIASSEAASSGGFGGGSSGGGGSFGGGGGGGRF